MVNNSLKNEYLMRGHICFSEIVIVILTCNCVMNNYIIKTNCFFFAHTNCYDQRKYVTNVKLFNVTMTTNNSLINEFRGG